MAAKRTLTLTILGNAKGAVNALGQLGAESSSFGSKMKSLGKAAGIAFAAVGGSVTAMAGASLKAFTQFDSAMTQSLAIMGDVSAETRKQMEGVARDVSKSLGIAAKDSAESFFFLASAGLDAEQSMAALPVVARFAKAGMFDMALATDLATDAQSALGLTTKDAQENLKNMSRVTDVLVKANTLANATVEQFSKALTTKAGAAMKAVNMDIEEGVAVLAAFADQGIKGEEAGTQFSIVLRDLQTKALKNAGAFKQFGVAVYDGQGNLNNMGDIVASLEGALDGMSDAQKRATLQQMGFSDKSLGSLLAILGTSDAIKGYEAELRNAGGTTEEVANKQLESFAEQMNLLRVRATDFGISIGSAVAPALLKFTDLVQTQVFPAVDRIAKAFEAGGISAGFEQLRTELVSLVMSLVEQLRPLAGKVVEFVQQEVLPRLLAALTAVPSLLIDKLLPAVVDVAVMLAGKLGDFTRDAAPRLIKGAQELWVKLATWVYTVGLPKLVENVQRLGDAMVSFIGTALRTLPQHLMNFFATAVGFMLSTGIPALLKAGVKLAQSLIKWTVTLGKDLAIGLGGALVALVAALPRLFGNFLLGVGRIGKMAVDYFMNQFANLGKLLARTAINLVNILIDAFNRIPIVPNIPRLTLDLDKATTQMGLTNDHLTQLGNTFGATGGKVTVAGSQLSAYEDRLDRVARQTSATTNTQRGLADAVDDGDGDKGGGGKGVGKSAKKAAQKLKDYTEALKRSQDASKGAADAAKNVAKAQQSLSEATARVAEAQRNFDQIVRGFGQGSKEATDSERSRNRAQRDAARATFDIERATNDVAKAERELAEVRSDPRVDPLVLREAVIKLEEARYRLADSIDAQHDADVSLTEAERRLDEATNGAKEGSETYNRVLGVLEDAKARQVEASDRVVEALEREREATLKLAEATKILMAAASRAGMPVPTAGTAGTPPPSWSMGDNPVVTAGGLVPFAKGGIVRSPVVGLVGEAGPEAVIPLDRMGAMGNTTINIYSTIADDTLPEKIVEALRTYNRRVGPVRVEVR